MRNNIIYIVIGTIFIIVGVYLMLKNGKGVVNTPALNIDPSWLTQVQGNVSFRYPKDIGTTYMHIVDWPPQIQVLRERMDCVGAGSPIQRAGMTEKKNINGTDYCVTVVSEGAAGSTYSQYAYYKEFQSGGVVLTFTIRMVQCENYDDPEKTECQSERQSLNIDDLVDKIMKTLKFN